MLDNFYNALVAILTAYLALTNSLAERLETIFDQNLVSSSYIEVNAVATTNNVVENSESAPEAIHVDFVEIINNSVVNQPASIIQADQTATTTIAEETVTETEPQPEIEDQQISVDDAIVNIYCTYRTDTKLRATTGTGFFVGENGVLLTNAHVAMFFLLEDLNDKGKTKCLIRSGSPATNKYYAELLYISPSWVRNNADVISSKKPTGTGERDFALLYISESAKAESLPSSFPALSANTRLLDRIDNDNSVTIGGYPVQDIKMIGSSLIINPAIATSAVTHIYTFGGKHGDLIALKGTDIGQYGMSGGPVVNESGDVIGLVTTKGNEEKNGSGSLNALTISYIHRSLREETGFGFTESLYGDLPYRAKIFRENLQPFLSNILSEEL